MARTPNGEQLSVEPLAAVVQNMFSDAPEKERQALEIIYSDLLALAPQATRKQLSSCLRLRTVLGRRVNEEIFARTGVLLGSGMKQNKTKEQLFAGTLDIRLFTQDDANTITAALAVSHCNNRWRVRAASARSQPLADNLSLRSICP